MDLDEMRAKLRDLGIPHDGWSKTEGGEHESPVLNRQVQLLEKVRDMLQDQVDKDKETLSQLHTQVQQMKHGGSA